MDRRIWYAIFAVGAIALSWWLLQSLASVLFPVFTSLIVAYLLSPAISKMEARGISRTSGILIILLAGLAVVSLFVLFFFPVIRSQILRLTERLPALAASVNTDFLPWLKDTLGMELPEDVSHAIAQYGDNLKSALPAILNKAGAWLAGAITTTGAVISSLLNVVLIPLFVFYFLRDFEKMKAGFLPLIPAARRDYVQSRLSAIDDVVGHWFRGQLQVAGILAVLYSTLFGLVFHFTGLEARTGIAVGILTGLLSVIPYVGAVTGSVLSVLFALLDWHGLWPFVGIAATFAVVQGLEGYVLTPRIVGEKLGLGPAAVIIALLCGGSLAGLPGMLFALPVTASLKILATDLMAAYRSSDFYGEQKLETKSTRAAPRKRSRK